MNTIDLSKIRPGDEVTVRLRILGECVGGWRVATSDGSAARFFVEADDIVSHTPKGLSVGDRALYGSTEFEIIAGPRVRSDGVAEYAIWNDRDGFMCSVAERLERVG
jgi:hypothetical protein